MSPIVMRSLIIQEWETLMPKNKFAIKKYYASFWLTILNQSRVKLFSCV